MGAPDVLVVGAGVVGLSAALACRRAGLSVAVVERACPGAGASGSPLGALAPYQPDRWSAKKAFQAAALAAAADDWAAVASEGGIDPGYSRIGRIVPLADAAVRSRADEQAFAADRHWPPPFRWRVLDAAPAAGWPAGACGLVHETLTARLDPRRAIAALVAALGAGSVPVRSGVEIRAIGRGGAETVAGPIAAGSVVIAAGHASNGLLAPFISGPPWRGVKGQAALLAGKAADHPVIAGDGLYIVPHADGTVAVGSTRETEWHWDTGTDARLDGLILAAGRLAPDLAGAPVLARWAGVRPRAPRPDPVVGWVAPGVMVATGSHGIGFGLAPALGRAVAHLVTGVDPALPAGFSPADHGLVSRDIAVYAGDLDHIM